MEGRVRFPGAAFLIFSLFLFASFPSSRLKFRLPGDDIEIRERMKKTARTVELLRERTLIFEQSLLELESKTRLTEEPFARLFQEAARLERLGRSAPAYLQERILRLQGELSRLRRERGYSASAFHGLYRQIDRLNDESASKFLSPYLRKSLERLSVKRSPALLTGPRSLLLYELGGLLFGVRGKLIKSIPGLDPEKRVVLGGSGPLNIFPDRGDAFYKTKSEGNPELLLLESKGGRRGVWCASIRAVLKRAPESRELEKLNHPHPRLEGRLNFRGKYAYVLKDENSGAVQPSGTDD